MSVRFWGFADSNVRARFQVAMCTRVCIYKRRLPYHPASAELALLVLALAVTVTTTTST